MANVGQSIVAENSRWSFDGSVSDTFEDHIEQSVPLYREGHDLIAKLSDFFVHDNSICYEIGCSTGALTRAVAERNSAKSAAFIGIDPIAPMIRKAQENCRSLPSVSFVNGDALEVDFDAADLIMSYYTIQFIRPKLRQRVFDKIYRSLNWGGAFICFEKVRAPDARFQDILTAYYTEFKLDKGFAPDEIVSKTRSLKGILEPFTTQANLDFMKRAGFVDVVTVMKHSCFEGFLAIK